MNSLLRVSARNHAGMILMAQIAEASAKGDLITLQQVADNMHLSQGFLEEIATSLKKAGLIKGRKGPGGGYMLAKPAKSISAEEMLTALEGQILPVPCSKGTCALSGACSSKHLWTNLQKEMLGALKKISLAKIVKA